MSQEPIHETVRRIVSNTIITQNEMRRAIGLPPIPFIHAYYHVEGVTDLNVFKKQAEKRRLAGQPSWIHMHKINEPCRKGCILINEKGVHIAKNREEDLDGGRQVGSGDE